MQKTFRTFHVTMPPCSTFHKPKAPSAILHLWKRPSETLSTRAICESVRCPLSTQDVSQNLRNCSIRWKITSGRFEKSTITRFWEPLKNGFISSCPPSHQCFDFHRNFNLSKRFQFLLLNKVLVFGHLYIISLTAAILYRGIGAVAILAAQMEHFKFQDIQRKLVVLNFSYTLL